MIQRFMREVVEFIDSHTAVVPIDVSATFMPRGGLAVPDGDLVVDPMVDLLKLVPRRRRYATRDVHQYGHICFASSFIDMPDFTVGEAGKLVPYGIAPHALFTREDLDDYLRRCRENRQVFWSQHGIVSTAESETDPAILALLGHDPFIKGMDPRCDSLSAFTDNLGRPTGFHELLHSAGVKRLVIGGLAYDFCAGLSGLDAVDYGFEVMVAKFATRSIGIDTEREMTTRLERAGVRGLLPLPRQEGSLPLEDVHHDPDGYGVRWNLLPRLEAEDDDPHLRRVVQQAGDRPIRRELRFLQGIVHGRCLLLPEKIGVTGSSARG